MGATVTLEPGVAERWREYRYRRLFHLTHDQYLDAPVQDIDWMLAIDNTYTDALNERRREDTGA